MSKPRNNPRTITNLWVVATDISLAVREFLLDCQARNLAPGSVSFYREKLEPFVAWLADRGIVHVAGVTVPLLRRFFIHLQATGHNAGGQHAFYRTLRRFFTWCVEEQEIESSPMQRVKPPKVPEELLEPVPLEHVKMILAACGRGELGHRDRAMILCLLDTGLRASELVALNLGDVSLSDGTVLVRHSKSRRPRSVFLGARSLKALIRYLRVRRPPATAPLWTTTGGRRLTYSGLREVLRRRARDAGVETPSLHSFRRGFALYALRSGCDVYSLQRLMGHSGLQVLRRYLAQNDGDLREAHKRTGPVDNLL